MLDLITKFIVDICVNSNKEEIDKLIDNNIFKINDSGLLYSIYEPEYDEFPNKTVVFFNGLTSIHYLYELFFKKMKPNYKILIFQNLGRYKSKQNNITLSNEVENYEKTIIVVKNLINELSIKNPIFIGNCYGTYGTIKISNEFKSKFTGIFLPFDLKTEYSVFKEFDCLESLKNARNTKFLILYSSKDAVCKKTVPKFLELSNCILFDIGSKHELHKLGNYAIDKFIRIIIINN